MTQLVYKWNFKNATVFLLSTILNRSQSALCVTGDTRMKDVLQLAAAIVMAFSAKKKNIWLQKFTKKKGMKPFSDNFIVEIDVEAQIS